VQQLEASIRAGEEWNQATRARKGCLGFSLGKHREFDPQKGLLNLKITIIAKKKSSEPSTLNF